MELSEKYLEAVQFAAKWHSLQRYGNQEYYVHLDETEQVLIDHGCADVSSRIQCRLHDILEGTDLSYNDLKEAFGIEIAEVVFLCTDERGRNRKERKSQKFYDDLKQNAQAVKIKVADRLANTRHSVKSGHGMSKMYKKEYAHFKEQLYVPGHVDSMWEELDKLMGV